MLMDLDNADKPNNADNTDNLYNTDNVDKNFTKKTFFFYNEAFLSIKPVFKYSLSLNKPFLW